MTTIIYTLGNGYTCGCCERTWHEEEDFYEATEEQIIERMAEIGSSAEDWRGIHRIFDYKGDADELERKIEAAIDRQNEINEITDKINRAESSIKSIDKWFSDLEEEKNRKHEQRRKNLAELEQLKSQLAAKGA
jgi:DNA repair exonuclease SbcCD ATPase subunit